MKYTKLTALASALCTAFTCTSASFTAFGINNELPEDMFVYENVFMQIVSDQPSSKPYLVVTGFTEEALQSGSQSASLHLPPEVDTCMMPGFEGQEEYGALEVREIGKNAFRNTKSLEQVLLPYTVEKIDSNAFEGCINLMTFEIDQYSEEPSKLQEIGDYAFYKCEKLSEITLPESLRKIDMAAFAFCSELNQIKIPAEYIDMDAFAFCSSLADVYILRSNADIYPNAFYNDAVTDPLVHEIVKYFLFYGTIHGYRGSTAQGYAEDNKCNFKYISELGQDAGDLNGDRAVSVEDAQLILKYYVQNTVAGTPATWEDLLYGKVEIAVPDTPVTTPAVTTTTEAAQTTTVPAATTVVVIQTTSAPAVTTAPALTTVTSATSAPPVTTTATVGSTAAPLLTTAAAA